MAVILVVAALVGALLWRSTSSGSGSARRSAAASAPVAGASSTTGPAPTLAAPSSTTGAGATDSPTTSLGAPTAQHLPLNLRVSSTTGLHAGQTVTVHVTPKAGSDIYGIEARVCAAQAVISVESDFYPNQTGNCALHPLSSGSDAHVSVAVSPPYQSADLRFRVGAGTDRFTTEYGQAVSITCGPGHPCQLVLLLQVPGGFGFQSYPLTFA